MVKKGGKVKKGDKVKKGGKLRCEYIDEDKLNRALLQTAIDRRYGNVKDSWQSSTRSAASAMLGTVANNLGFNLGFNRGN